MCQDDEYKRTLLLQAAEIGNMLFWKYNVAAGTLELSGEKNFFSKTENIFSAMSRQDNCFARYIHSITTENRQQFKDIVYGNHHQPEGNLSYQLINTAGKTRFHLCRYNRICGENGDIMVGTITDETGKIWEDEKESIFEIIAKHSNIGLFYWDPLIRKGYVSSQWYKNFGLTPGKPLPEAMHELALQIHPDDQKKVRKAGIQLRTGKKEFMDEEFRICGNDPTRWARYTAVVKKYDRKYNNLLIIGLNQDITRIKKEKEQNTKILEALPDFIFVFDEDFNFCNVLKSKYIHLFHKTEELIGVNGRKIFSPEVSQQFLQAIHNCLQSGELEELDYYLDAQNERHYFQARMIPFDGNKVIALIHNTNDRMKRTCELVEARQKAEEADRMKSAFLANMSHEIRTPLNAIIGFSDILVTCDNTEEKEAYAKIIHDNSDILLQLIDDLLDLSRIESGKTEITMQPIEAIALVEEARIVHQLKMKPGVELRFKHPNREIWLKSDRNKITQVISNFISNAIKNTEQGSITLKLSIEYSTVRISVTDTGCGIPEDKQRFIFERFAKLNSFTQGTGLGLSICQTIADKLGGRLEVHSTHGKGSTFSLLLPYQPGLSEQSTSDPERKEGMMV